MPAPSKEEQRRQKAQLEERYQAKQQRIGPKKPLLGGPAPSAERLEAAGTAAAGATAAATAYLPPPMALSRHLSGELDIPESPGFAAYVGQKMKENPLVPAGALLTVFALGNGLRYMVKRKTHAQQQMMRLRVFGQGFTILALVIGTVLTAAKK